MFISIHGLLTTETPISEENISSLRSLRYFAANQIRVHSWFNVFGLRPTTGHRRGGEKMPACSQSMRTRKLIGTIQRD